MPVGCGSRRRGTDGVRPRRLVLFALVASIAAAACAPAPEGAATAPQAPDVAVDSAAVAAEITAMLQSSAEAWNRGDLEGFLDDYTDDPGLAFVGASGVRRGKDAVRTSYQESYFDVEGEPDDLAFDQLEVRPLGPGFALAHGRWTLFEPGFEIQTVSGQGRFSLVLRKEGERWRIIHDHSS